MITNKNNIPVLKKQNLIKLMILHKFPIYIKLNILLKIFYFKNNRYKNINIIKQN